MADMVVNNVANTEENRVADIVTNMKVCFDPQLV